MYRFLIEKDEWILRFSPGILIDPEIKKALINSIVHLGNRLLDFKHGESFIIYEEKVGAIVFLVEKIPSAILTVSSVVQVDQMYRLEMSQLKRLKLAK